MEWQQDLRSEMGGGHKANPAMKDIFKKNRERRSRDIDDRV